MKTYKRDHRRKFRNDLDSTTSWSNTFKCKYMKEWRRRPTPLSFYLSSYFLSSLFWLRDIFTCDQESTLSLCHPIPKPTSEVKHKDLSSSRETPQKGRNYTWSMKMIFKKTITWGLRAIHTIWRMTSYFFPTFDPNGKPQDYLIILYIWSYWNLDLP